MHSILFMNTGLVIHRFEVRCTLLIRDVLVISACRIVLVVFVVEGCLVSALRNTAALKLSSLMLFITCLMYDPTLFIK